MLREGVVQVAFRDAEVGVDDVLDAHDEEGQAALAGQAARQHRFAAAGRSVQQDAAAGGSLVLGVQVRSALRQHHHAVQHLLHVGQASDVGEGQTRWGGQEAVARLIGDIRCRHPYQSPPGQQLRQVMLDRG